MRIFQEVVLPDTCYVPEAAYWAALGRVPELLYDSDGNEARNSEENSWDGSLVEFDRGGFSSMEFRRFGPVPDMERYWAAIEQAGMLPGDVYIREEEKRRQDLFKSYPAMEEHGPEFERYLAERRELDREAAAEADWARSVETVFGPAVDLGRAKVFEALAEGKLSAFGWLAFSDQELEKAASKNDEVPLGRYVDIAAGEWTLRNFDWDNSRLLSPKGEYRCVQVRVGDMVKLFPRPHFSPLLTVRVDVYGDTLILADDDQATDTDVAHARPRGRPSKGGGTIKDAVQRYFGSKISRGETPQKAESLIQEAIEFVERAFGEKISRSTAQSYLQPLKAGALENTAGK